MINVGGDDGAAPGHFFAYEFRSDVLGQKSAEIVPGMLAGKVIPRRSAMTVRSVDFRVSRRTPFPG